MKFCRLSKYVNIVHNIPTKFIKFQNLYGNGDLKYFNFILKANEN